MTFCTPIEAIESIGRATDWGSSSWFASEVCSALPGNMVAEIEITLFDKQKRERVCLLGRLESSLSNSTSSQGHGK